MAGATGLLSTDELRDSLLSVLPQAYGYALRLTRNRADAEDLVQDAALLAIRGVATFTAGTNFDAWFFRILTRQFWSRLRGKNNRVESVDLDEAPELHLYEVSRAHGLASGGDDPAALLFDRLGTERVADAIAQLPVQFREVAALYFIQDFSYQEIADVLELPVGTVRSRLHRGRRMLQKSLWQIAQDAGIVQELATQRTERQKL